MAFDSNTRNKLQRMVAACRDLLTGEFEDQLQERYGIYPTDGRVLDIDKLPVQDDETVAVARLLRSRIGHLMAGNTVSLPDAVRRVLREQAFTVLNRFAALRMAEERGLIPESIAGGVTSKGAQVFADLAGPGLGGAYDRYRVYLDRLLDELALDLRVLFDRFSPLGLLFPRENVLTDLLAAINASDIAQVWAADEAIGWIYQYFNDPEERKQMRNESSAPRNSRELAVRNQFFTPRYVVEFLTDNTLGRIWYEMCRGKTRLAGQCRYMVRRPKEIFLNPRFLSSDSDARPWVKELAMGDFASAPEDATWREISQVALLFDGYEVAEQLGLGDLGEWALPHLETLMAGKDCGLKELWEFWLVLFVAQRRYLKEGLETRFPEIGEGLRFVWNTWRAVAVSPPAGTNTSQEELLQQPVIIPVRFPKDPREIRMLDPACGSMHFGLYAFDLYEVIYEEALQSEFGVRDDLLRDYGFERYPRVTINAGSVTLRRGSQAFSDYHSCEIPTGDAWVVIAEKADGGDGVQLARPYILKADAKFRVPFARRIPLESFDYAQALKENWFTTAVGEKFLRESRCFDFSECFASEDEALTAYRRDIPRLIIHHNIHGVDIDPRAVQIAGLSLWLRAQRAWKEQNVTALARPTIRKSNIVCAEPMPGDEKLLGEFSDSLQPRFLGQIVRQVWKSMRLAGEAGSLLKIEEEIADWVKEAKRQWTAMPKGEQLSLFESPAKYGRKQEELNLDLSGITDAAFWEEAEGRIYDALRDYAEQGESKSYQRRLFADDAAQGFAFIDLCRKRYDVVVMNPPFGLATGQVFEWLRSSSPDTYTEMFASFVSRGLDVLVDGGLVGAITSRAFLTTKRLREWRRKVVISSLELLLDLGGQVMDSALVESCAYTSRRKQKAELIYAVDSRQARAVADTTSDYDLLRSKESCHYVVDRNDLSKLPGSKILYSLSRNIHELLRAEHPFEPRIGTVRQGMGTFDDFRFVRLRWEIPTNDTGFGRIWEPLAKGGAFAKFYSDIHLALNWADDGKELGEVNIQHNGQVSQVRQASDYWRKPACTYSKRSQKGFSARALPSNCIITGKGPAILSLSDVPKEYLLGWLNSRLIRFLIELQANYAEFNTGILKTLPWKDPEPEAIGEIAQGAAQCAARLREIESTVETNSFFIGFNRFASLAEFTATANLRVAATSQFVNTQSEKCNVHVDEVYGVSTGILETPEEVDEEATPDTDTDDEQSVQAFSGPDCAQLLLSYLLGITFGRWDIRYGTGELPTPELPDPFAPLPVCPPGMLQGANGLPLSPEAGHQLRTNGLYPLDVAWDGILVDDPDHPFDLERRVHAALAVLWGDRADALESEACALLGVPTLREWFRRPAGFFADHLKRYSKSRRQAPIYWPLSTASGRYTLWIYYHRLTDQTLFQCVTDFIKPKIVEVESDLARLRTDEGPRTQIDEMVEFLAELTGFRDELLRIAALPWKPNLNDGVLITASPLWKLFRLPKWQKDLKACWQELEKGEYDWSHLAYTIWPDRVNHACETDRSLAIAHGLEHLCKIKAPEKKAKRGKKKAETELQEEKKE